MGQIINYEKGEIVGNNNVKYLADAGFAEYKSGRNRKALFECPLCGKKFISVIGSVKNGKIVSCGCYNRKINAERFTKHNLKGTRLYRKWQGLKNRCLNPHAPDYQFYGARNIKIYKDWINNPVAFIEYCKTLNGWEDEFLTLDRINPYGNYEPNNIRFVSRAIQARNQRTRKGNKTGYTGVSKQRGKFISRIMHNGKEIYLGIYRTTKEAAIARDKYIINNNIKGYNLQVLLK